MSRFFRLGLLLLGVVLAACAPTPKRVVLLVDGDRRVFDTLAVTVQDVLREQGIAINDNDRIEPPLFAEVERSATITVTRIDFKIETVTQPLPFGRQLVRDENYPQSQIRVVQLGANGSVAITYTITLENGKEAARRETVRKIVAQPKDEILAVGTQGSTPPIALSVGTITFLANGNAWVMRHSSGDKRPLTATNDLDGRVFSLSVDGRYLLFTRAADENANAFNSLWIVDTLVLGETPRALPVKDVLFAQLAPDARALAYTSGEKTPGAPGWKAHNDLWYAALTFAENLPALKPPIPIWKPSNPAPYSWWGANFAWANDGGALVYALPNEIGLIELANRAAPSDADPAPRRVLRRFAPFRASADWVWVPQVAWSYDSRFVLTTLHAPLANPDVASDDPGFEVWALARDGTVNAPLAKQTGMWARPVWSPPDARGENQIAFGVALAPSNSEKSRYALVVMDRDGGNKKQIALGATQEDGLVTVEVAWSPDAKQLIVVRDGDLWLHDLTSARWGQLTANGAARLPRWSK